MTDSAQTMTPSLNLAGSVAAFCLAASYIFGFALFIGFIDRSGYEGPIGNVAFVTDNLSILTMAMLVLYPLAAFALTILVIAVNRRASAATEVPMQIATAFGLIWAGVLFASGMIGLIGMHTVTRTAVEFPEHAASAWLAITVVQDALGGGNEFLGGVWMVMVSWLFMGKPLMPKPLAWLGIILGLVGIVSLVPTLGDLVDIFGFGQIVWFTWLGARMLNNGRVRP